MLRLIKIILICVAFVSGANLSYAIDWRKAHEAADKEDIKRAIANQQADPKSQQALYELGLVYLNAYKIKEAEATFTALLNDNPESVEAKWALAEILRRKHKLDKSENSLSAIIKRSPDFAPAYISLAYIKYIKGDFRRASRLALSVIRQGRRKVDLTNYVRAYLLYAGAKGMIAHYGGPISKVINGTAVYPAIETARGMLPEYAGVYYGLGSFYLLSPEMVGRDIKKAKEYLEKAVKADPFFPDSYVRLSQVYELENNKVEAQIYLNKALAVDPGNELALDIKNGGCKFICTRQIKD